MSKANTRLQTRKTLSSNELPPNKVGLLTRLLASHGAVLQRYKFNRAEMLGRKKTPAGTETSSHAVQLVQLVLITVLDFLFFVFFSFWRQFLLTSLGWPQTCGLLFHPPHLNPHPTPPPQAQQLQERIITQNPVIPFCFLWDKVFLCSPGWFWSQCCIPAWTWTWSTPASVS